MSTILFDRRDKAIQWLKGHGTGSYHCLCHSQLCCLSPLKRIGNMIINLLCLSSPTTKIYIGKSTPHTNNTRVANYLYTIFFPFDFLSPVNWGIFKCRMYHNFNPPANLQNKCLIIS